MENDTKGKVIPKLYTPGIVREKQAAKKSEYSKSDDFESWPTF